VTNDTIRYVAGNLTEFAIKAADAPESALWHLRAAVAETRYMEGDDLDEVVDAVEELLVRYREGE
jgi:hypothetical protein